MPASPLEVALLVLAALAAGAVDAVAGGGGLLTVPALAAAGLPPHLVLGTNKGQSVFGSSSALVAFARAGLVDRARARLTFPLGFLGSLAGAALVLAIRPEVLRPLVLALLVLAALVVGLRRAPPTAAARLPERLRLPAAGALAILLGAYDGFFGPGTGTFLILGFVGLLGEPPTRASAEAKVVNFASNLAGLL
ncbi:MAG TPA: TSUP family transporter, partial [Anaeromyxobacteraceae bacterium]